MNFTFEIIGITAQTQVSTLEYVDGHSVQGIKYDLLAYWYIKIPLFIHVTYSRVCNTGINKWFTLLFILPIINLVLWFWPPMTLKPNDENNT